MGVVWCRELPRERDQSGKFQETYVYTRSWLIRVDDHNTPLPTITNATGFAWKDPHPDDPSCKAMEFDTKVKDDVGLLYTVTVKYYAPPVDSGGDDGGDGGGGGDPDPGNESSMRKPTWSGSSSTKTVPAMEYQEPPAQPKFIVNSAGQPLEGLEMERTEPRLSLTQYYASLGLVLELQRQYSDSVNDETWAGGAEQTWRCLGCSFHKIAENVGGVTQERWEVTWEFAYDRDTWRLKPWDVGFSELCDANGVPSGTGEKNKLILGQDKKPVRQPVPLAGGVAKPAGQPPSVIMSGYGVEVYPQKDFSIFGEPG